jgi:hypothetical protein
VALSTSVSDDTVGNNPGPPQGSEAHNADVQRRARVLLAGAAAVGAIAVCGAAVATWADDGPGRPISGDAREKAAAAALAHTGGGRVTGTEVGDEESLYEVEITRSDGSQVDVQLDKDFHVVGDKVDSETPGG